MKNITIIVLVILCSGLVLSFSGCCKRCCSPSVEVGVLDRGAKHHYCPDKIEMWTWDPITSFPRNPNQKLTSWDLQPLRPYLAKAQVTNFSDVEVRGVTVAFYWASFGLFDWGTPIGAVGVDIPPKSSQLVSSPWCFTLSEAKVGHLCLAVRVFHPCDTDLLNNYCYVNFRILVLREPWKLYVVPFTVDFRDVRGALKLEVEVTDPRARARIVAEALQEGAPPQPIDVKSIQKYDVKPGIPQDLSLVIENVGGGFKPGESFDVTVSAIHQDGTVASFTVSCEIGR